MSLLSEVKAEIAAQRKHLAIRAKRVDEIKPQLLSFEKHMRTAVCGDYQVNSFFGVDRVCVIYYIRHLVSFKDSRLVTLLDRIVQLEPTETETSDYPDYLNREYRFTLNDSVRVVVNSYVKSDSPTCRKVLQHVETRVIEHRTYKMECD